MLYIYQFDHESCADDLKGREEGDYLISESFIYLIFGVYDL